MALRLGMTPTYHFSWKKLRALHLERSFSASPSSLGFVFLPYSISKRLQLNSASSLRRIVFLRQGVLASSLSEPQQEQQEGEEVVVVPKKRGSVRYDLSSGFLQSRRYRGAVGQKSGSEVGDIRDEGGDKPREGFGEGRNGSGYDERGWDYNERNWKRMEDVIGMRTGSQVGEIRDEGGYEPRELYGESRNGNGSEERGWEYNDRNWKKKEEELAGWREEDEGGDWMGSQEESRSFKNSKLYEDPEDSFDYDMKNKYGARSGSPRPVLPPSSPSIPGRFSKYSRPAHQGTNKSSRKLVDTFPTSSAAKSAKKSPSLSRADPQTDEESGNNSGDADSSNFIPAVIMPEHPYQFSYTETPKVAPIGFREPVYSPFGPETMDRPWTGRAPIKPSKKKLPEFDSFNPPQPGKKGVKYVQPPGPYPLGEGPKLGQTREEILGEPLSKAEVKELVERTQKESRQLNLGRDGLTHNMLAVIHEHWKRRRVCKVKCKGVPTVDMDNVCNVLEEKTGGVIIHRAGGTIYLYRGRNYNYKTRPKIPIMLWHPPAPIYPKLIPRVPEGLTVDEADKLRALGRKLPAICHLGKNGVYLTLVNDVKDAFRVDDLVKVDCKGMNPSDYKKIGAKLKDLVPCVLLSWERECILMWRGPEGALESSRRDGEGTSGAARATYNAVLSESGQVLLHKTLLKEEGQVFEVNGAELSSQEGGSTEDDSTHETGMEQDDELRYNVIPESCNNLEEAEMLDVSSHLINGASSESEEHVLQANGADSLVVEESLNLDIVDKEVAKCEEAARNFDSLWQQAVNSGEAVTFDEPEVDPDILFEKVKSLYGPSEGIPARPKTKKHQKRQKDRSDEPDKLLLPRDPTGLLRVDELAKLLAP